jgi:hypothetical protein
MESKTLPIVLSHETYIANGELLLTELHQIKNKIEQQNKFISENLSSIETLERNLGKNEYLTNLKEKLDIQINEVKNDTLKVADIKNQLNNTKSECLIILNQMLNFHSKLEQNSAWTNDLQCNPITIETAKSLFSTKDNLQLRDDPPIGGVLKDESRHTVISADNNLDSYNDIDLNKFESVSEQ